MPTYITDEIRRRIIDASVVPCQDAEAPQPAYKSDIELTVPNSDPTTLFVLKNRSERRVQGYHLSALLRDFGDGNISADGFHRKLAGLLSGRDPDSVSDDDVRRAAMTHDRAQRLAASINGAIACNPDMKLTSEEKQIMRQRTMIEDLQVKLNVEIEQNTDLIMSLATAQTRIADLERELAEARTKLNPVEPLDDIHQGDPLPRAMRAPGNFWTR